MYICAGCRDVYSLIFLCIYPIYMVFFFFVYFFLYASAICLSYMPQLYASYLYFYSFCRFFLRFFEFMRLFSLLKTHRAFVCGLAPLILQTLRSPIFLYTLNDIKTDLSQNDIDPFGFGFCEFRELNLKRECLQRVN